MWPRSSDPHVRFNGQARFQQPFCIEVLSSRAIKIDTHWDSLHDFHVVSRGVLGRQQAEHGTCTATQVGYMCFPSVAVSVKLDVDGLPWPHVGKLRFLEIGCNPHIVKRHDLYQFLSDADVLAHFDRLLADNSCNWRTHHCVAEFVLCLFALRL